MPPLETTTYRLDPVSEVAGPDEDLPRRVAAGVAHNVNNALAGVISYLELALRETEPGGAGHRCVGEALACAWRAAERVRRMAAFARGKDGHPHAAALFFPTLDDLADEPPGAGTRSV